VTLTVPPGTRVTDQARSGVICHMADLPGEHLTTMYGMPATTAARTVVDIARMATFMEGVVVADSALYERHTSKTELRRMLLRCDRWPGISRARQVVEFADGLAESDGLLKYDSGEKAIAELKRDRLLREAGYEVIHFTWPELFSDPVRVADRIREAFG
jgi:hypothetical protein